MIGTGHITADGSGNRTLKMPDWSFRIVLSSHRRPPRLSGKGAAVRAALQRQSGQQHRRHCRVVIMMIRSTGLLDYTGHFSKLETDDGGGTRGRSVWRRSPGGRVWAKPALSQSAMQRTGVGRESKGAGPR